jgi:hypothetical protein
MQIDLQQPMEISRAYRKKEESIPFTVKEMLIIWICRKQLRQDLS